MIQLYYASGAMGYGDGYWWHKGFNFPKLPLVTKTITMHSKKGYPYAVFMVGNFLLNKIALRNVGSIIGFDKVKSLSHDKKITISVAGNDWEIQEMVNTLNEHYYQYIEGIELNYSCPNVISHNNKWIPDSNIPLFIKLNANMDPYDFELDNIKEIRLNSLPFLGCGLSGKWIRKRNWAFIEKFIKEGLNVSGSSISSFEDIKKLCDIGCTSIGIGSIILTNPLFVEKLKDY